MVNEQNLNNWSVQESQSIIISPPNLNPLHIKLLRSQPKKKMPQIIKITIPNMPQIIRIIIPNMPQIIKIIPNMP
jgi:hypothetical protein